MKIEALLRPYRGFLGLPLGWGARDSTSLNSPCTDAIFSPFRAFQQPVSPAHSAGGCPPGCACASTTRNPLPLLTAWPSGSTTQIRGEALRSVMVLWKSGTLVEFKPSILWLGVWRPRIWKRIESGPRRSFLFGRILHGLDDLYLNFPRPFNLSTPCAQRCPHSNIIYKASNELTNTTYIQRTYFMPNHG